MDKKAISWEKKQELRSEYYQELAIDRRREERNRIDNAAPYDALIHRIGFYRRVLEFATDLEKALTKLKVPNKLAEVQLDTKVLQDAIKDLADANYSHNKGYAAPNFMSPDNPTRVVLDKAIQAGLKVCADLEKTYGRSTYKPEITYKRLKPNIAEVKAKGLDVRLYWDALEGTPYANNVDKRIKEARERAESPVHTPVHTPVHAPTSPSADSRVNTLDNLSRKVSNWPDAQQAIESVRKAILSGDKPSEDDLKRVRNALYKYGLRPQADMFRSASVSKITKSEIVRRLKADHWHQDRHDPSYLTHRASFYSIYVHHLKHTGTKEEHFLVVWYTGNPAKRWESRMVKTLDQAVTLANEVKPESDRITAGELGEELTGKLASRVAMQFDSKDALDKYLEDHPGADRANHSVKKSIKNSIKDFLSKSKVKPELEKAIQEAPPEVHEILTSSDKRKEAFKGIATAIHESGKKISKKIQESAHKELHEIKHAVKAAQKILRKPPQPITKEDRRALYAAGAYVAGAAIATIPPGGALMAAGALGKAFALHVGIKAVHDLLDRGFVHFEWGEHVLHGLQHVASEDDAEEMLFEHLTAHVTHQIANLPDLDSILSPPEKIMKTATPGTFRLSGAISPKATLLVTQTDLNKYQITIQKPGVKKAEVLKSGLSQREAEQAAAVLAVTQEARITWVGNPRSMWSAPSMPAMDRMRDRTASLAPGARTVQIPQKYRESAVRADPQGTDVEAYKYLDNSGRWIVMAWVGRATKPSDYYWASNEVKADKIIQERIDSRKNHMAYKQRQKQDNALIRQNHEYKVGDILTASWGYDETNSDAFQVVAVSGQKLTLREIASKTVRQEGSAEYVMPVADRFVGAPMNRMVSTSGIKIDDVRRAYLWNGKPQYQTAAGFGH